ncbi:hypothetical protein GN958_ATG11501 [Phytophthora infestans]|uniref:Uncharacterized protein n=1 Tax=Phytophthora infestans TaxID=4787 RepID=A0A8S9UE00_PHYIN|nr:hypothetical protein GN958_ATG11501 [Phytophthora infestans]
MALNASREEIRDDRYYRSLLLGPRMSSATPSTSSSASSPSHSVEDGSAHTLLALKTSGSNPFATQLDEKTPSWNSTEPLELKKRKRKYRKATHTIRKEEKERLQIELATLQARMEELKQQAMDSFGKPGQIDKDRVITSKVLRDAVQRQQLEFATIQGIMSEYALSTIQAGSPLQRFIHLSRDEGSRRDTLLALKPLKLKDADYFLTQRRPNVDPCKPMCEDRRYELPNGDFCSTRFTTIQFHGVESVKQVFDTLVEYFCNIEISISEKLGHITIREDDDSGDKGVTQNRLVSTTINGLLMESNTVLFSQFFEPDKEPGHERGRGLIVADFVDEDERHPYRPYERIRRNINAILELTSYTRKVTPIGVHAIEGTFGEEIDAREESVVVLTRWVFSQLNRPSFAISTDNWDELRDNMDRWGETMHRSMIESLKPRG